MNSLFNERALRHQRRQGDGSRPITLLTPPLRATLVLGLLIAIGGALWATLARIPLTVQGTGALLPVSTINTWVSGTSGSAIWMFNQPAESWHRLAKRFQARPDQFTDQQIVELSQIILSAASTSRHARINSQLPAARGQQIPADHLLIWVQSASLHETLSSGLDQLRRLQQDTSAQADNINTQQAIIGQELGNRSSYLASMSKLAGKGYVSRATILQEQAQVDALRSQIHDNKNKLIILNGQRAKAYQSLRDQLANLISKELIFAPRLVYLSQILPNNGASVQQGDVLFKLSNVPLNDPVLVPLFLSSKEMAQVFPGMEALATPSGYQRSAVGGIRARVVSMAKLPGSLDYIRSRVGVEALAQMITAREPSPTMAVLELERAGHKAAANSGGYRWSSQGVLPYPPTPGDRLDVEVTTRRVAPMELLLPSLRRLLGLSPPESSDGPEASPPLRSTP